MKLAWALLPAAVAALFFSRRDSGTSPAAASDVSLPPGVLLVPPDVPAPVIPAGYRPMRESEVTPSARDKATTLLAMPYGTTQAFTDSGNDLLAAVVVHFHTPGGPATPWGYHKGVTLYIKDVALQHLPPVDQTTQSLIATLRTPVQKLAKKLLAEAALSDIALDVVQAFRSAAQQDAYYAQGRTAPGPIVTGLKGGQSMHEWGLAFDVAVDKDGKPTWPANIPLWTQIGVMGEALGLVWGGRFPHPDYDHFELHLPGIGPGLSPAPDAPVA